MTFSGHEAATNWAQEFTLASTLWFAGMSWHLFSDDRSCINLVKCSYCVRNFQDNQSRKLHLDIRPELSII